MQVRLCHPPLFVLLRMCYTAPLVLLLQTELSEAPARGARGEAALRKVRAEAAGVGAWLAIGNHRKGGRRGERREVRRPLGTQEPISCGSELWPPSDPPAGWAQVSRNP